MSVIVRVSIPTSPFYEEIIHVEATWYDTEGDYLRVYVPTENARVDDTEIAIYHPAHWVSARVEPEKNAQVL